MTQDVTLRNKAELLWRQARSIKNKEDKRDQLSLTVELFLQIQNKTIVDINKIARLYSDIALLDFNKSHYLNAGENYTQSINWLLKLERSDEQCRSLVRRYIDLADSCYEFKNHLAGDNAIANAIKAFELIKIKTHEELELQNPASNFEAFYTYHEIELAESEYRDSTDFKNHLELMKISLFSRLSASQLDDKLSSLISGISISMEEKAHINTGLESLFNALSIVTPAQVSPFITVRIAYLPENEDYIKLAQQFIVLINQYIGQEQFKRASTTTKETIAILRKITVNELHIKNIISQLEQLLSRIDQQNATYATTQLLQIHGFLGNQTLDFSSEAQSPQMMDDTSDEYNSQKSMPYCI